MLDAFCYNLFVSLLLLGLRCCYYCCVCFMVSLLVCDLGCTFDVLFGCIGLLFVCFRAFTLIALLLLNCYFVACLGVYL